MKTIYLGLISILLIALTIGVAYFFTASKEMLNFSLSLMGLFLLAALICAATGTVTAVTELFRGSPNKVLTIIGLILDLILSLFLLGVGGIIIYILIYIDPKNFRL